eukprot:412151-Pelagomonas_calceolata.AAC.3
MSFLERTCLMCVQQVTGDGTKQELSLNRLRFLLCLGYAPVDEQLFQACNVVLPCWIMLAILPNSKMTKLVVILSSIFLCALYGSLVVPMIMEGGLDFKDFMSLPGVAKALSNYRAVLPSWVSLEGEEIRLRMNECLGLPVTELGSIS